MPLDTRIPLMVEQPNIDIGANYLRAAQMQGMHQEQQMNALKMREFERQSAVRNALANAGGSIDDVERVALQLGDMESYAAIQQIRASQLSQQVNQQKLDAGRLKIERDRLAAEVNDQASLESYIASLPPEGQQGFISRFGSVYSPEAKMRMIQTADSLLKQNAPPTAHQKTLEAQGQARLTEQARHNKEIEGAANRRADATEDSADPDKTLRGKGYERNTDGTLRAIPGGPADPEVLRTQQTVKLSEKDKAQREARYPKATAARNASLRDLDVMIAKVDELANHPGLGNITGTVAGRTPNLTNEATGAQAILDSIRAGGALAKITELRQNSPTGGALGNVSDRDIVLLKDAAATLAQSQGTPEFKRHLNDYLQLLKQTKQDITEAYDLDYEYRGGASSSTPGGSGPAVGTVEDGYRFKGGDPADSANWEKQ